MDWFDNTEWFDNPKHEYWQCDFQQTGQMKKLPPYLPLRAAAPKRKRSAPKNFVPHEQPEFTQLTKNSSNATWAIVACPPTEDWSMSIGTGRKLSKLSPNEFAAASTKSAFNIIVRMSPGRTLSNDNYVCNSMYTTLCMQLHVCNSMYATLCRSHEAHSGGVRDVRKVGRVLSPEPPG